jgi:hypothetical protein
MKYPVGVAGIARGAPPILGIATVLWGTIAFGAGFGWFVARHYFVVSPEFMCSFEVQATNAAIFVVLLALGWLTLSGPFWWAELNSVAEGAGAIRYLAQKHPARAAFARRLGPALSASAILCALYPVEARLMHGLSDPTPFREGFDLVEVSSGYKASNITLLDSSGVRSVVVVSRPLVRHLRELAGTRVEVTGVRSWAGTLIESVAAPGDAGGIKANGLSSAGEPAPDR